MKSTSQLINRILGMLEIPSDLGYGAKGVEDILNSAQPLVYTHNAWLQTARQKVSAVDAVDAAFHPHRRRRGPVAGPTGAFSAGLASLD